MIRLPSRYDPQLEVIGSGGFATVFRTTDLELGRRVAVKVPFRSGSGDLARETSAELKAIARLRHPNIVQLLDAGVASDGSPFLVMEYADAGSFASAMGAAPPPWEELLPLLAGVLAGHRHAHAAGLIHRDVKPENVLLGPGLGRLARPMLSDFGLAKLTDRRSGVKSTRLGAGTALYMAPEQFEGESSSVHPGADLYAFGVMLYRIVTGHPPWHAENELSLLFAKLHASPRAFAPRPGHAVPEGLDRLVFQLLARRPEDRPPLAADVRRELAALGQPSVRFEDQPTVVPGETVSVTFELPRRKAGELPAATPSPPEVERVPPTAILAAVREPLLVDRQEQRDRLWRAARRTSAGPVGLVLTGARGQGRSRLCRWLLATLEELGQARGLRVRLEPAGSATEALAQTLRHHLRLGRLDGVPLRDRIEKELTARGLTEEITARRLADWLDPGAEPLGGRSRGGRPAVRLGLVDQLLRAEGRRGMVCLWIEDRGSGDRGSELAESILRAARAEPYPLLLLYEGPSAPVAGFETVEVGPLAPDDLAELLRDVLPEGGPHGSAELIERARGNAALAMEWVRLDAMDAVLAAGPGSQLDLDVEPGLAVLPDGAPSAAAGADDVARARGATFVQLAAREGPVRAEAAGILLLVLALLPRPAPRPLFDRVLADAVPDSDHRRLLDEAREVGLLVLRDQGWDFASQALADGARIDLDERPDRARLCRLAAAALLETAPGAEPVNRLHAGRLLLDAGDLEAAYENLVGAGERFLSRDLDLARDAFVDADRAADAIGLSVHDPRRLAARLGAGRAARNSGRLDEVLELLAPAEAADLEPALRGGVLELLGSVRCMRGQLDEALACAEAARSALAKVRDGPGLARVAHLEAEALLRRGDRTRGLPRMEEALELARSAGSEEEALDCLFRIGSSHRAAGDLAAARPALEETLASARRIGAARLAGMALRELGNLALLEGRKVDAERLLRSSAEQLSSTGYRPEAAVTRISLGELRRARGRLREARREYAAALSAARAFGLRNTEVVALVDLGMTELGMERPARAAKRLRDLDDLLPAGAPSRYRPWMEALRLALAAAEGRWDDAEDVIGWLEGQEVPADGDLVALLEDAARRAGEADELSLAGDALGLAVELAGRAEDPEAVARVRAAMAALAG